MNWLYNFWYGYWWPSIKGNGPEDVTSLLIVGTLTAVFVPVVRRWFKAHIEHLHAKLDHIIVHSKEHPQRGSGPVLSTVSRNPPRTHQPRRRV